MAIYTTVETKRLINAVLVDVKSVRNHFSANATNRELTPKPQLNRRTAPHETLAC
jgi:hypothetical protein